MPKFNPNPETTYFGLTGEQVKSVAIATFFVGFVAFKRGQRSGMELFKAFVED